MSFESYNNFKLFKSRPILSIDYGQKVAGLASFTPGKEPFPQPFGRIIYKDDLHLIDEILKLVEDEFFEVIILGLPFLTDGQETKMTKTIRNFSNKLKVELSKDIELYFQDETLTTREAQDRMKNSPRYNFKVDLKEVDALAASIILEDFIKSELPIGSLNE